MTPNRRTRKRAKRKAHEERRKTLVVAMQLDDRVPLYVREAVKGMNLYQIRAFLDTYLHVAYIQEYRNEYFPAK